MGKASRWMFNLIKEPNVPRRGKWLEVDKASQSTRYFAKVYWLFICVVYRPGAFLASEESCVGQWSELGAITHYEVRPSLHRDLRRFTCLFEAKHR